MLNKTKKMFPVFIALAIFVFLLVINYNTPMIGEDFALSPSFYSKENFSFLNSIHWIVDRVYIQSTTWNARIGEQLAIVFLTFNKDIFNICNSILTMIYGYLIFLYAFNRKLILKNKQDTFSILVIFVLVVLFMPALGEIFFWETGSANYLWSLVILLLFGYPFRRMLAQNENVFTNCPKLLILYYIISFLSGMTNENTIVAFVGFIFIVFLVKKLKKQKIYLWMYISSALYLLGIIYLLISPSTRIRSEYYKKAYGITEINFSTYFIRFQKTIISFVDTNFNILIFFSLLLVLYFIWSKVKSLKGQNISHKNIYLLLLIVLLSFASVIVLVMVPYVEKRAFLLPITTIIIASTNILSTIYKDLSISLKKIYDLFILSVLICISIYKGYQIYTAYYEFNREAIYRESQILYLSEKSELVKVEPYKTQTSRILNTREDYIMGNNQYFGYYHLENIVYFQKN
ncbi:hypothetical protein C7121_08870 [Paenibacillus glucanolyticus]|jgi:hypothetical protein|uniref:DUF6056 family protein n=1 Tax=Paenibacillus TaxID=44249 RepID=UPI0003E1BFE1|nr:MULTISPECIES: DUF6056 family protein [Paenibacillus]ANA79729.1 hypothetical protein A3958_06970 [Paenibacillus glucanolyticus]AVV56248.1 hypothetical protein C7121_08870 [Paenibacillus glucanolyticus]ETT34080.1 hypothetical protein C169_20854 [Paenibacillus sp. FSL R5-808]MPY20126.1 hypothetical protein [Paenibacillus glucanolyticus]